MNLNRISIIGSDFVTTLLKDSLKFLFLNLFTFWLCLAKTFDIFHTEPNYSEGSGEKII
jgi:hypothetical protein